MAIASASLIACSAPYQPRSHRRPQRILIIGAEQSSEFAQARKHTRWGDRVTVVNPIVTTAAQRYSADGGDFRPIRVEALPPHQRFHRIYENYPYPLGRTPQSADFARVRFSLLNPGGRWIVISENKEFVDALRDIAQTYGLSARLSRLPLHQAPPAAPRYIHPRLRDRYCLTIFDDIRRVTVRTIEQF